MKKKGFALILCLALACSVCAGEPNAVEPGIVFTAMSADGAATCWEASLGYQDDNRFEYGFLIRSFETDEPEVWQPNVMGPYLLYLIDEFGYIDDDTKPDNPIEAFLHKFKAQPYGGIAIVGYTQNDPDQSGKVRLNFKTGLLFAPIKDSKIAFVMDWTIGDWALGPDDKYAVKFGARIKF